MLIMFREENMSRSIFKWECGSPALGFHGGRWRCGSFMACSTRLFTAVHVTDCVLGSLDLLWFHPPPLVVIAAKADVLRSLQAALLLIPASTSYPKMKAPFSPWEMCCQCFVWRGDVETSSCSSTGHLDCSSPGDIGHYYEPTLCCFNHWRRKEHMTWNQPFSLPLLSGACERALAC